MIPKKVVVITAPSGSGKTTLVKRLLKAHPQLDFSASACTRLARPGEKHGLDYIFLSELEFKSMIEKDDFVEWEMVYSGKYYGTLKSELNRIWQDKKYPLIDIDVRGAIHIKEQFGMDCLSIFIEAPSIEELRRRLTSRGTENPASIEERITKAQEELTFRNQFDCVVVNEHLETAEKELIFLVDNFIKS